MNEKIELEAQKEFYNKIEKEMGEKMTKKLETLRRINIIYLPFMALSFAVIFWIVGLKLCLYFQHPHFCVDCHGRGILCSLKNYRFSFDYKLYVNSRHWNKTNVNNGREVAVAAVRPDNTSFSWWNETRDESHQNANHRSVPPPPFTPHNAPLSDQATANMAAV